MCSFPSVLGINMNVGDVIKFWTIVAMGSAYIDVYRVILT